MKHLIPGIIVAGCVALGAFWLTSQPTYAQTGDGKSYAKCVLKFLDKAQVEKAVLVLVSACRTLAK